MIHQLNPTIDVSTPLGDATAIMIIDYGLDVNSVWLCRMPGGEPKHFYSDDIRIYDNPMNGKGFDVDKYWVEKLDHKFKSQVDKVFNKQAGDDIVHKIPADAKRNTDFLKKELPVYYEISDRTITLIDKKIGSLDDVFEYIKMNLSFKSDKPIVDRSLKIETGSLGLMFLNEFVQEKTIDFPIECKQGTRQNVISPDYKLTFYMEPFGKLEVKYDKELDKTLLDNRKYQGLPLSSAMLKLMDGDNLLFTFYAVAK